MLKTSRSATSAILSTILLIAISILIVLICVTYVNTDVDHSTLALIFFISMVIVLGQIIVIAMQWRDISRVGIYREPKTSIELSIILLVVSVVGFAGVFVYLIMEPDTAKDHTLLFTLASLGFLIIMERVVAIPHDAHQDAERAAIKRFINDVPSLIAGRNDIVTFISPITADEYCISAAGRAVSVRNTVFRYGRLETGMNFESNIYDSWVKAKRHSLTENLCSWTEIVSSHLHANDPQRLFMTEACLETGFYNGYILDDKEHPMMQMTVFEYSNGSKEILFGWEFPTLPSGPCFLTKHEKIIGYFEGYFAHYVTLSTPLNNYAGQTRGRPPSPDC